MIWYCYTEFGPGNDEDTFLIVDNFSEFKTLELIAKASL